MTLAPLVIYCDGIGTAKIPDSDDAGRSILRPVAQAVAAAFGGHVARVIWPAAMLGFVGGSSSWTAASEVAIKHIDDIVHASGDRPLVLLAYSGGNLPVHEWLDRNADMSVIKRVKAVGFLSDPFRPHDKWQKDTPQPAGYGICGPRYTPLDDRAFWATVPRDVISDASPDALLRTLADISDALPGTFLYDLGRHLDRGDLQLAWQIGVFRRNPLAWFAALGGRLHRARLDVEGYLGGTHTAQYHRPQVTRRPDDTEDRRTPAQRLSDTLIWAVRKRL